MLLRALPLVFVLAGLALYTVLAGADFGAGFWQLFAGRGERADRIREHAHHSMSPVWEANHVWLIFVLTVTWTAYPRVFGSIASTLAVPLFIAALGIIFRGAAYALRAGAASGREAGLVDTAFSLSSIITPFALGAVVGAIASNRVPVGNAAGRLFGSWINPTSAVIGVLAVAACAYLAAVYLAADAARHGDDDLASAFRLRALGTGVATGAIAIAGIVVLHSDSYRLFHELVRGAALAAVIVSGLAGIATLALVYTKRFEPARYTGALAVAAIIAGWAFARWPTLLPGLSIDQAAAGHDTLVSLLVAVLAGGAILFPSLVLLFRLTLTGRLHPTGEDTANAAASPGAVAEEALAALTTRLAQRTAAALLIAGVGLLNLADAQWAHAIGVLCLLGFIVVAFPLAVSAALAASPPTRGPT